MMKFFTLFLVASSASLALAGCPNKCSGHGTCGLGDTCSCQPMWVGPDCAGRECPSGVSWVTSANTDTAPSGTDGILAEGNLAADTTTTKTKAVLEARHHCGAADCWKGKYIQFMGTDTAITTTNAGGVWSPKYLISANTAAAAHEVTYATADYLYLKGTKYRITGSGGLTGRHHYTECSSMGTCDRSSGECACFDGYEGRGCRRQACPNACSGHGRCVYNNQINPLYAPTVTHPNEFVSQYWDYKKTRQCVCDRGHEGYDCSSRICPKGDDPLTDCDNVAVRTEISDIQELTFPAILSTGWMTLTFTDMFNGNYTTKPIEIVKSADRTDALNVSTAKAIETALEELPNFTVPNVTVTHGGSGTAAGAHIYTVTFVDEANSGPQNLLMCSGASFAQTQYNNPNAQPRFLEPKVGASAALDAAACISTRKTATHYTAAAGFGSKQHVECSNRGVCDGSSGLCTCFEGFSGEACATQTVFF